MNHRQIRYVVTLLVVSTLHASESSGDAQWHLMQFLGGHPVEFQGNRGTFWEFLVSSSTSRDHFGPVTMWQPEGSKDFVQISQSLSGLDEAFRVEGQARGPKALDVVLEYVRLYRGTEHSYPLLGQHWASFLAQFKNRVPAATFEKIRPLLPQPVRTSDADHWEISFSVVTWRGAIERWTYEGAYHPMSISKETVGIVAPTGTVPDFGYKPWLDPDRRGQE